jgi:hypothetical protein
MRKIETCKKTGDQVKGSFGGRIGVAAFSSKTRHSQE